MPGINAQGVGGREGRGRQRHKRNFLMISLHNILEKLNQECAMLRSIRQCCFQFEGFHVGWTSKVTM